MQKATARTAVLRKIKSDSGRKCQWAWGAIRFPPVPQSLLIEWLNGLVRVPIGGRPVVRTGVQVSVFSGRLHRIPRTYPRFWAGLRALKLPIYPFFGPAYRPGPPRFIRTAGRPLCVYSGVLAKSTLFQAAYILHTTRCGTHSKPTTLGDRRRPCAIEVTFNELHCLVDTALMISGPLATPDGFCRASAQRKIWAAEATMCGHPRGCAKLQAESGHIIECVCSVIYSRPSPYLVSSLSNDLLRSSQQIERIYQDVSLGAGVVARLGAR